MSPLTTFSSRRRTILVFFNPGGGKPVERLSIGRFDYDGLFTVVPTPNDGQHEGLRKLVEEKRPARSSASTSPTRGTTPTASPPTRSGACSTRSAPPTRRA